MIVHCDSLLLLLGVFWLAAGFPDNTESFLSWAIVRFFSFFWCLTRLSSKLTRSLASL